jgi:DNA (cytosine-5)-methyltransferase 1
VWTGSCPCQPFSVAGTQKAQADDRHLWPYFFRLIRECRPPTIFMEQVRGAITHGWLDEVSRDLEGEGYAVGSAVLPACGAGAPHRRERLWVVGDTTKSTRQRNPGTVFGAQEKERKENGAQHGDMSERSEYASPSGQARSLADPNDERSQGWNSAELPKCACKQSLGESGSLVSNTAEPGSFSSAQAGIHNGEEGARPRNEQFERRGVTPNPDGKQARWPSVTRSECSFWEPESAICRVANGIPARVGRLRAYGNAIVPQVAAAFITAFLRTEKDL